ncbi:hypothetical protein M422DRAFT_775107 [Sphaerobolus stellatus SS14]|nr:hypothetical protein M422DRAFT_775107 [Sphaerobolus stellatus SS14]
MSEPQSSPSQPQEASQTHKALESGHYRAPNVFPSSPTTPTDAKTKKPKTQSKAQPNADRPPGKSLLPTARVQKIMKADKELPSCNKEAVFLISVATEEFIKRLSQAGQQQANREKRSTVQRKDVVTAVRKSDEFVFLEEILAANAPAATAPVVKRKSKATAPLAGAMIIQNAFAAKGGKIAESSGGNQGSQENNVDHMDVS